MYTCLIVMFVPDASKGIITSMNKVF